MRSFSGASWISRRDSWVRLVDAVLRPRRPHRERCENARVRYLENQRTCSGARAAAIASCVRRIENARRDVFAANDGVVPARMTELEREWRLLSRPDPDGGLMDLWAKIAPPSWIDRKPWRDSAAAKRLDVTLALASDIESVEAAERAARALRAALGPWRPAPIGDRIRWRAADVDEDTEVLPALLAEPLRAATAALARRDTAPVVLEQARHLETEVLAAASARLPTRAGLARDLAHAAFVGHVWQAAAMAEQPDPVTPLRALWATGYTLSAADAAAITLEIPSLVPSPAPGAQS